MEAFFNLVTTAISRKIPIENAGCAQKARGQGKTEPIHPSNASVLGSAMAETSITFKPVTRLRKVFVGSKRRIKGRESIATATNILIAKLHNQLHLVLFVLGQRPAEFFEL